MVRAACRNTTYVVVLGTQSTHVEWDFPSRWPAADKTEILKESASSTPQNDSNRSVAFAGSGMISGPFDPGILLLTSVESCTMVPFTSAKHSKDS